MIYLITYNTFVLINLLQADDTNFNDLGKLMLLGFITAVLLAVGFTFVRIRIRDKKPQSSGFTTISGGKEKK